MSYQQHLCPCACWGGPSIAWGAHHQVAPQGSRLGRVGRSVLGFRSTATPSDLCLSPPQNCQTFSSLSCLNTGTEDRSAHSPFALHIGTTRPWAALLSAPSAGGRTPAGTPVPEPLPSSLDDPLACREEPCCEEPGTAWRDRRARSSPCSLDGELDIEQIENN